jgi:hypothetical protein
MVERVGKGHVGSRPTQRRAVKGAGGEVASRLVGSCMELLLELRRSF